MSVSEIDYALVRNITNPFIRNLHFPSDSELKAPLVPGKSNAVRIQSRFRYTFSRTSWSVQLLDQLESNLQNSSRSGDTYRFSVDNKNHHILASYIVQPLEKITLKQKFRKNYRMCYTPNTMHAMIENARLEYGGRKQSSQPIKDVWLDVYSHYFMKAGFEKHYNRCIGNIPELQKWSSSILPSFDLMLPLPWSYSRTISTSIPLYLCSLTKIDHVVQFRNRFSSLIRFQKQVEGVHDEHGKPVWKSIRTGRNNSDTLPPPEMWAFYANVGPDEIQDGMNGGPRAIYGEDIEYFKSSGEHVLDPTTDIPVKIETKHKTVAKATFWVAQNQTALQNNYYSNYSTNSENHTKGDNPFLFMSMQSGGHGRYEKLKTVHTERAQPWFRFPSAPRDPGYNAISHGYDVSSLHADAGLILGGDRSYTMSFVLGHSNFYQDLIDNAMEENSEGSDDDSDETDSSNSKSIEKEKTRRVEGKYVAPPPDKFLIHVIFLVMNKIMYDPNPDPRDPSSNNITILDGFNN
jgi:hypothetical protein